MLQTSLFIFKGFNPRAEVIHIANRLYKTILKMALLSINIPTYERLNSFSTVLTELATEVGTLNHSLRKLIEINVFDNDSTCHILKKDLCEDLAEKFNLTISFKKNEKNIGGDANIHKSYTASPHATFTWVLGDDDRILKESLEYITDVLQKFKQDLGLLILSDNSDSASPSFVEVRVFPSYCDFALDTFKVQPNFLIGHTLISSNIIRSSIFSADESLYSRTTLYQRYGINFGFAHMRGILFGLLRSEYKVIVGGRAVLDTTMRLPLHVDIGAEIFDIYYFHLLWLLTEVGVRVDQVKGDASMAWLSRGVQFQLMRLRMKIKWKARMRQLLVLVLGENLFSILRKQTKVKKR